jgi:hypothetical protein
MQRGNDWTRMKGRKWGRCQVISMSFPDFVERFETFPLKLRILAKTGPMYSRERKMRAGNWNSNIKRYV